jgi:hypothetical protein
MDMKTQKDKLETAIGGMLSAFSPGKVANLTATINLYMMPIKAEGLSDEAGCEAARRFWIGVVPDRASSFAPTVAEFMVEARRIQEAMPRRAGIGGDRPKLFGFRKPNSKLLEPTCTKEWGRQLVDHGAHPRGSIWVPGPLFEEGKRARPNIGELYAPDPEWKHAVPLN